MPAASRDTSASTPARRCWSSSCRASSRASCELYPMIRLEIEERVGAAIVRAVADGTTDIGIVGSHTPAPGLATIPYHTDQLVLVVPAGHPLASRKSVKFAEAIAYPFVSHHAASSLWALMTQAARETGAPSSSESRSAASTACVDWWRRTLALRCCPSASWAPPRGRRPARRRDQGSLGSRQLVIVVRDLETLPYTIRTLIDHLRTAGSQRA